MGSEGTNAALSSLQSKDYAQFLDVIDLLRSQGISHYVQLPQLIVCGDQSSGKSSVLEAVSGVRFPTKDNLCTRFATELILRRSSTTSATIAILPGSEKSDEEKKRLLEFKAPTVQLDDFPSLIDAAKDAMGLNSDAKAFSDDVLRVEISGPRQPHLTLVDLPGLIHAENKQQSAKDVRLVQSLVRSYMANTRSIILAVVSAKNDYANQIVTKLARDVDPGGLRTLGIITKPDMLHVGSESETAFLNLARNEDVVFRLGWHVLRNRDFDSRECSVEERDERERNFFSQGVWTSLTASTVGIMALKPRLSTVLINHVVSELPSLVRDIKAGIDDCRRRLSRLGEARQTPQEQRRYLVHVSRSFSSIVKAAVDGVYVHEFFGDAMTDEGFSKRLRAVVQDLLLEFAKTIHREGHDREIVENAAVPETVSGRKRILRSAFEDHVRELIRRSRGRELPGTLNPLVVGDLFFQQAGPWKGIVDCFSERILQATRESLELVLLYTTDESTREGLRREVIGPAMEWHAEQLKSKVEEILRPHRKGHAITYNHYFTENVQKAREDYAKRVQARRVNTFGTSDADAAMDRCTCSEAVDCMQAYYKVIAVVDRRNLIVAADPAF